MISPEANSVAKGREGLRINPRNRRALNPLRIADKNLILSLMSAQLRLLLKNNNFIELKNRWDGGFLILKSFK
jgi:hypothetical protein